MDDTVFSGCFLASEFTKCIGTFYHLVNGLFALVESCLGTSNTLNFRYLFLRGLPLWKLSPLPYGTSLVFSWRGGSITIWTSLDFFDSAIYSLDNGCLLACDLFYYFASDWIQLPIFILLIYKNILWYIANS